MLTGAVGGDRAPQLASRSGVVHAVVLNDVVLDERVGGPPVDGEVRVHARTIPSTSVGDSTIEDAVLSS